MNANLDRECRRFASALILLCLGSAGLLAQPTWRVSVDSDLAEANGSSGEVPAISLDGRFVAFDSYATNLVPRDTNARSDIFVHDRATGTTRRISIAGPGRQSDAHSFETSISADGQLVAFRSGARNLVPKEIDRLARFGQPVFGIWNVFVHDAATGTMRQVSVNSSGGPGNQLSFDPAISADGRFVVFTSSATNLAPGDSNGLDDVFVHELGTATTWRVSGDPLGGDGNGPSFSPAISADGRFIVFTSTATNLVPGDVNDQQDVFVHDRMTGTTRLVSVDSSGAQGDRASTAPAISPDGQFIAFHSTASNLVPGDVSWFMDIFVHDLAAGTTRRVSVDSSGAEANGMSYWPAISSGGRFVAFESDATNLVPGDTNAKTDTFVHDTSTGRTVRVSVHSSGSEGHQDSEKAAISGDGRFIAFHSLADDLVPSDTNWSRDIFVRDLIWLELNGTPQAGSPVSFTVSNAFGESGNRALVLLSCSGTSPGFVLPDGDGRRVYLNPDHCTSLGLQMGVLLQGVVGVDGTASTPVVPFPVVAPGLSLDATGLTLDAGGFVALTSPTSFVTQ